MILIVISTLLTGYIKCGVDRDRPDFEYEGAPFPVEISRDTYALFCEGGYDASYPLWSCCTVYDICNNSWVMHFQKDSLEVYI